MLVIVVTASACSSAAKYPHDEVRSDQKMGVYAIFEDSLDDNKTRDELITKASRNATLDIQKKLSLLPVDKTVLKYFMQSFPARTRAQVIPIRDSQISKVSHSKGAFDVINTGKNLSLDYVMLLHLKRHLKSTGYHFHEQWGPELKVTAELIRITDGKTLMLESVDASDKPFDKFQDSPALNKSLDSSFSNLASITVNQLSEKVGPVVRSIPDSEKQTHQKIYNFGHIRSMASRDNCVISGELIMEKSEKLVTYQVPCRDITLTYACDSESESSHCWLQ